MISKIVRLMLSIVLLYFIYQETGPATTLFAILVLAESEIASIAIEEIKAGNGNLL